MLDHDRFITDRLRAIDASGIRRVFDLAANLKDPINLSIGQPDFDVPDPVKQAGIHAIQQGFNRYTQTQGAAALRQRLSQHLAETFPQTLGNGAGQLNDETGLLVSSGVSGGLMLAMLTCVGPGDEVLIPDPYFVMYRHLVTLSGATPVFVDTYPDFQPTPQRIEPHITERTKLLLFNSPSNPTGVMADDETCRQIAQLCRRHNILLLSDEIYDAFQYRDPGQPFPSPLHHTADALLMRGYSKTYAMTGWRLGYVAGPRPIVEQMAKLQQYSFVCAPSIAQAGGEAALDVDMTQHVQNYRQKRDRVVQTLSPHYELTNPQGAFYAFPRVPEHLGLTATQFVEKAVSQGLLIIPGSVFSERDTHFRLSYACDDQTLQKGLDMLVDMARGRT